MAGQHALLSPSSAHIWLNCPPAARLAAQYDDTGSQYAQQGSDAHELCEYKLLTALGQMTGISALTMLIYKKISPIIKYGASAQESVRASQ